MSPSVSDVPFASRHVGPRDDDIAFMLETLGYDTLTALMSAAVPTSIATSLKSAELPVPVSEVEVGDLLTDIANINKTKRSMIGLGYYGTITPGVIRRNILENPAWYTAYTPYQPEISQGRLEALLNFQTLIGDLTGLPTANSSLLDEGTAAAEAMTLAYRAHPKAEGPFIIDADALPQTIEVMQTRATAIGIEVRVLDLTADLPEGPLGGVLIQYPGARGAVLDPEPIIKAVHDRGGIAAVATDLLALTVLQAPGELDADIVIGSSQRFGVPLFYGGPHAAFMAVRTGLERHLPGRLVGVSKDSAGRPALRLALQTREQHIRRDRATSNICTAQVLLSVVASMYAVYHGPEGLRDIAEAIHLKTARLAQAVTKAGHQVVNESFFDTITVQVSTGAASDVVTRASEAGLHFRLVDSNHVGICIGEDVQEEDLVAAAAAFGAKLGGVVASRLPADLIRSTPFLTHPVFNTHQAETNMLRYLRRLSARDYALDRGMIPLGSCTMKLNATMEMEPLGFEGFANLHPFAPAEDALGYRRLIEDLESWLAIVTGYDQVSIQPNAGSQGELAGLLAIRAYHVANGDPQRTVCLLPASAHGTNAASAAMAGMRVVVVKSAVDGTIDLNDLYVKCKEFGDTLAAVMVTYPSTHGVYEHGIRELCDVVHEHGGQVYIDGANFNALLGFAKPGEFGGDVSHLNLHKTFCIPHGGGGPGVGPVAVRAHLAEYLPTHGQHPDVAKRNGIGPVSAAPYGSAGILPISWAYIRAMGTVGLSYATSVAVLSANYVAARLGEYYPVLYRSEIGLVAHECILDLREITKVSGVSVDDVAKRLIDYGFHAPTMSFPVAGTLMVEPTESEDLAELDRFIDAMIAIRGEIACVETGEWDLEISPLRRAPHTAEVCVDGSYDPQTLMTAVFPNGFDPDKYWPPVGRIDGAFGDRNLVCSCPPLEAYGD